MATRDRQRKQEEHTGRWPGCVEHWLIPSKGSKTLHFATICLLWCWANQPGDGAQKLTSNRTQPEKRKTRTRAVQCFKRHPGQMQVCFEGLSLPAFSLFAFGSVSALPRQPVGRNRMRKQSRQCQALLSLSAPQAAIPEGRNSQKM